MDELAVALDQGALAQLRAVDPQNTTAYSSHLFEGVFTTLTTPLMNAVAQIDVALANLVIGELRQILLLAVVVMMLASLFSMHQGFGLFDVLRMMFRFAVISTVLGSGGVLHQMTLDPMLHTIPDGMAGAIAGTLGGTPVNGGAVFDTIWNKSFRVGIDIYNAMPGLSLKWIVLAAGIVLFWASVIVALSFGFLVFIASHVMLALVVAVAPVFIACGLVPYTRSFFGSWVNVAVGAIAAKVLVVALMSVMVRIQTDELTRISGNTVGANDLAALGAIFGLSAIVCICAWVAKQIPMLAQGLAHGAWVNINSFANSVGSAAMVAASYARRFMTSGGGTAPQIANAGFNQSPVFASAAPGGHYTP